MMSSLETCYFLCLAALSFVVAGRQDEVCDLGWLFIDIHYRNVDVPSHDYSYGLFIGSGVVSQNQSLWPSISHNETRFAAPTSAFCGDGAAGTCFNANWTHGHFDIAASESWRELDAYKSLDSGAITEQYNLTYGQDRLNLFTHFMDPSPASVFHLEDHPIVVLSEHTGSDIFFHSGSAGLGPSSTILEQLVDVGRISRKVVGFYLGTAYPRAGGTQNGSAVLGGYDGGRLVGEAHRYPQVSAPTDYASPFKVHVDQISLVTSDGSSIPLITDDGFDGYVSTDQYPMELPEATVSLLAEALGASPADNADNSLQAARPFDGNLTITLSDGFQITYPSEWITNVSNIMPFSASTLPAPSSNSTPATNSSRPLILGASFLHHLYMAIDYDNSTFSLAEAKTHNNYVMPRPLCEGALPVAIGPPKISQFQQMGMVGVIVGTVVAGLGLTFLLFMLWRKRMQKKMRQGNAEEMERGAKDDTQRKNGQSSLRRKTKAGLVHFANVMHIKDTGTRTVRSILTLDATSSNKQPRLTIRETGLNSNPRTPIELTTMKHNPTVTVTEYSPVSPISSDGSLTLNDHHDHAIRPAAEHRVQTPGQTGQILSKPDLRGFTDYADDDESDLEVQNAQRSRPQSQPQFQLQSEPSYPPPSYPSLRPPISAPAHKRTNSDKLRAQLALKIDSGSPPSDVKIKEVKSSRVKMAPLPLQVRTKGGVVGIKEKVKTPGLKPCSGTTTETEKRSTKRNPMRSMFRRNNEGSARRNVGEEVVKESGSKK